MAAAYVAVHHFRHFRRLSMTKLAEMSLAGSGEGAYGEGTRAFLSAAKNPEG